MSAVARKDYGANAKIPLSNSTMRLINSINSPYSPQATGIDKEPGGYIQITKANLDSLTTNTRVLFGNVQGYVKTVTLDTEEDPELNVGFISCVIAVLDKEKVEQLTTYTADQLIASGNLFLVA